ncbi:hypothetical protein CkaCkLH20_08868 [Colletotrichum karsti]|uniref:Uncharacterized protein n=1 Tax=Colletotrichum karsti TaxID=1095194 RepID=A0A9P6HY87_9PEZI|nr:uncharacterized protein CkaCkLH20_08868 [Colletotrichum karsti]KAF9873758.1 hypothetical protein CkaCkLH20_08868 [Colletotrichum karsti]
MAGSRSILDLVVIGKALDDASCSSEFKVGIACQLDSPGTIFAPKVSDLNAHMDYGAGARGSEYPHKSIITQRTLKLCPIHVVRILSSTEGCKMTASYLTIVRLTAGGSDNEPFKGNVPGGGGFRS